MGRSSGRVVSNADCGAVEVGFESRKTLVWKEKRNPTVLRTLPFLVGNDSVPHIEADRNRRRRKWQTDSGLKKPPFFPRIDLSVAAVFSCVLLAIDSWEDPHPSIETEATVRLNPLGFLKETE
ncbi:hypothetical protein TNCV_2797861 [Trichonephila clavipes]|nr:hypothetical protein TNCV_2797861 [Trichonephila clavipes]